MFDGANLRSGLCDWCDQREGAHTRLANELLEPGVMSDNKWVGGYSPDKAEKWRAALGEASRRLTKTCVVLHADCDSIALCRGCVGRLLSEFPTDDKGGGA